jgi:hypothetical protein
VSFGHGVERASVLEPLELASVKGVRELAIPGRSIIGMNLHRNGLADSQFGTHQVNLVVRVDLVVVGWVGECKREHPLLLQVGLML